MVHSIQRTLRALLTWGFTNLAPGQLIHNQIIRHLSYFMIIFHKSILKSIQKIVPATNFSLVDQKHQGTIATILTEEPLQTLSIVYVVLEMTSHPLF